MSFLRRPRWRRAGGRLCTLLAAALVYLVLVVPDSVARPKTGAFVPGAFLRVPLEAIAAGAVLLALPARWRRRAAALLGAGLGVLAVLTVANMGFRGVLGRRFNPVLDWPLLGDGYNALVETDGHATANLAVVVVIVLLLLIPVLLALAGRRLAGALTRHAEPARRGLIVLAAAWLGLALTGVTLYPDAPVAADSAAVLARTTVRQIPAALRDQRRFAEMARTDPFRDVAAADLVSGLAGKDVVIGVVESYGRSSLTDPAMSAIVGPVLDDGERRLAAAGYRARSGWLTSSTFGGGSWLAHASFQSGLWIDNQQRYRQLTAGDRLTLTSAFRQAGWHTVAVEPGNTVHWPEGEFYGYETVHDSRNLGYRGPRFGWSRMPDQYALAQFQRTEYGPRTGPLMAEVTLTSSHEPWTPVPATVPWEQVGDGTVFGPMAERGEPRKQLWRNASRTRTAYATSIAYSVESLVSWAQKYGDRDLVLVIFGDHQPIPLVSGPNSTHDVPVTIVAHDPAVLDRIAGWRWTDGLRPAPDAPLWRMDRFRDRFFTAFGRRPGDPAVPGD